MHFISYVESKVAYRLCHLQKATQRKHCILICTIYFSSLRELSFARCDETRHEALPTTGQHKLSSCDT